MSSDLFEPDEFETAFELVRTGDTEGMADMMNRFNEGKVIGTRPSLLEGVNSIEEAGQP